MHGHSNIKFVVAGGSMYVDLNMIYHNGISFTKKKKLGLLKFEFKDFSVFVV